MRAGPPLLLAGSGHAHLFVLEALRAGLFPRSLPALLVAPAEYHYSGMIPGTLAGDYPPDASRLHPGRLAAAAGARWVDGRVDRVDAVRNRVRLDDGSWLDYRLLSLDIGSVAAGLDDTPGAREYAVPIRPVRHALRFREAAERALRDAGPGRPAALAIVGGGAAGVETALCMDGWLAARFGREAYGLRVLEAGPRLLDGYSRAARERVEMLLRRRGIEARTGAPVVRVEAGALTLRGGERVPAAATLWATGPAAPPLLRESGLAVDAQGWLRVRPTLQAVGLDDVFGAGDCVAVEGHPEVERAGVYAVREGPPLARNLARRLRGQQLERYEPQRDWLSLLNTGDRRALLRWRGLVLHNRAAWWLKDRIDRRFMRRFHALQDAAPAPGRAPGPAAGRG